MVSLRNHESTARDTRPRRGRAAGLAERWRALPALVRFPLAALAAFAAVVALTSVTGPAEDLRIGSVGYYMLAIAGLQLLIGYSGQVSLGHGAFMFIGAYTMALLVLHQPAFPLWLNMLITVAVSCAAGVLVGAATARLHGPYLAGATLALAVGLPALTVRFPELLGGSNGLAFSVRGAPPALAGVVTGSQWQAAAVWLTALLGLVVLATVNAGRLGRRMRALRDDESAAALAGIPVGRTKVVAFLISAGSGGLAGACQAYLLGTATPSSFTVALSLSLLAALVLGGLGSMWGAFWGAVALVYVELWGQELAHSLSLGTNVANNLPIVFFGVLLILVILIWPQGLHGMFSRLAGLVRRGR
ncbi:branched-chain amino acid ABC transporter permease [Streptomonospora nanhaiensis]|uniref:Branched-chain amino acid transport system permease protein n=1 Tax=Streptomonospora nanhaiensis TaxID=1323731 RepID=A0A853BH92_9ACTN|nr:branched-chain amino acid ABC transporter permease [Streptomonospora nanhaiensis]MBV2366381.1 branched-chain amino acid ABC transporter permease [Streptomonospora nanhaiensis]MBX9388981.1 branched-chain amino acid ABC transporter permease [Streptomonospora nanhaiensis]NYI94105.1 branched-chain amino acid transport system permease protein [Streptomonospora nanhaiensis]